MVDLARRTDTADSELERQVAKYLNSKFLPALRQLGIEASMGVVTLRGRVGSFYEKQIALHSCHSVAGVKRLVDLVEVA